MEKTITFVGLDVHKKSISVAVAEGGLRGAARFVGTIANTPDSLTRLAGKLADKGGCFVSVMRPGRAVTGSGAT